MTNGRVFKGVVALVMSVGGVLVAAQPAHAAGGCATVSFANADRDLVVSVELGHTGIHYAELRARSGSVGPWERFTMCWLTDRVFTLKSLANGKYVSNRENDAAPYQYLLTATADVVGEWEKFTAYDVPDYFEGFTGSSGLFVSADFSYPGSYSGDLVANRGELGPWETFLFHRES